MGRPKTIEPRREQLNISLTEGELHSIKERAAALGQRPVHFARLTLLNKRMLKSAIVPDRQSRLIHHQLIRLGNNLNQMVRALHHTGDPLPSDLEPLLADIRALITRVGK